MVIDIVPPEKPQDPVLLKEEKGRCRKRKNSPIPPDFWGSSRSIEALLENSDLNHGMLRVLGEVDPSTAFGGIRELPGTKKDSEDGIDSTSRQFIANAGISYGWLYVVIVSQGTICPVPPKSAGSLAHQHQTGAGARSRSYPTRSSVILDRNHANSE